MGKIPDKTMFLLDGQQRMTCLTNVFSDVIHESTEKKVSRLSSRKLLANRFYLRISRWHYGLLLDEASDLFGIGRLDFRFDVSKDQEPDFLTADIIDQIECRPFLASEYDKRPYMPCQKYTEKLDSYCFENDEVYMIPLFLLIGSNDKDDKIRKQRLLSILNGIQGNIAESICTRYRNEEDDKKEKFAKMILYREKEEEDESDFLEYYEAEDRDSKFDEIVRDRAGLWINYFKDYLDDCVEHLQLSRIDMPEGSRARAIDIYENMNMGGLSLSTFDLVAARLAKVSNESLYDRVLRNLKQKHVYQDEAVPDEVAKFLPEEYNASQFIKAYSENEVAKECSDLFLEVLGLYCNNLDYNKNNIKAGYSKSAALLKLSAEEINTYCDKVCIALDRAFGFLQVRCGIRYLSEVNYKIMVRFIAYIFTNDNWYADKKVHKRLEAWYWAAIFSGEYDKDPAIRFEDNLVRFIELISNKDADVTWLKSMKEKIFEAENFSDCDFLLMEKAKEGRIPKGHLSKYVCQFFLSRTYSDFISENRVLSVFTLEKLEQHHVIPLGCVKTIGESTKDLRKNGEHILNSPLNYVFISESANKELSDTSLKDYQNKIPDETKYLLCINEYPTFLPDLETVDNVFYAWMKKRHGGIKGAIKARVENLM